MSGDPAARQFVQGLATRLRAARPRSVGAQGLQLKDAAVLAPLFWRDGEPWVLLTKRPKSLKKHPGQISFPGGARESADVTPLHTALRETDEELGIAPSTVEVLGMLGGLPIVTGYYVTPFVGFLPTLGPLRPSPGEIELVLEAPLWRLRREQRFIYEADRPVFVWGDAEHVVWGATQHMLQQLLEALAAVQGGSDMTRADATPGRA